MTNDIISNSKEKEIEIRLKNLQEVLAGRGEITIIGHDNIDVDAVLSGVLLTRLLQYLNIKANFAILQPIQKNDTYQIISKLTDIKMEDYETLEENELRTLFLIDHYETKHSGQIIGCIDHHPTEEENTYEFSYVRNCTAVAYMIYELMVAANYPLTAEDVKLVIIAMMVDTTSFRSSKTIPEEVKSAKILAKKYNLDYDYLEQCSLCLTPIEKMDIDEITSNGQKEHNYNGHKVKSAYLQLYDVPNDAVINKWLAYLNSKVKDKAEAELIVFIILDIKLNITYEYQVKSNYIKKIIHDGILSRGKDIMSKIEKRYYNSNNNEEKIEAIIKTFSENKWTIATMESCTGGSLAGAITDVSGASDILHESYVTYCNDAKVKFGVPSKVIEEYSVYSLQTAKAMANAVKNTAQSDVGVGITGQLGRIDPRNIGVENNKAWYCIKTPKNEISAEIIFYVGEDFPRKNKKDLIISEIIEDLEAIFK
jgi:PncC family amidohydrolase